MTTTNDALAEEDAALQHTMDESLDLLAPYLEHYGILGMKWGRRMSRADRNARRRATRDTTKRANPSFDAVAASRTARKISEGGRDSVSNRELRAYLERVDLNRRMDSLEPQKKSFRQVHKDLLADVQMVSKTIKTVREVGSLFGLDDKSKNTKTPVGKVAANLLTGPKKDE